MRRLLVLAAVAALLAGCGGGSKKPAGPETVLPGSHVLFQGTSWAVVVRGAKAVAAHLDNGTWVADRSGNVKVEILGPQPGQTVATIPQVAVQLTSPGPLVESALWVDGTELDEKGGGSPTRGTIYGAPGKPLKPGRHVAVGYGRTALTGTAVAWSFRVK